MAKGTTSSNFSRHTRALTSRRRSKNAPSLPASMFPKPSKTELDALRLRLIELTLHEHPALDLVQAQKKIREELETIGLMEVHTMLQRMPSAFPAALLRPVQKK